MPENLEEIKVGDKVLVSSGFHGERIAEVTRLTATKIVVGDSHFNRKTGYRCGESGFDRSYLQPATSDDIVRVQVRALRSKLMRLTHSDVEHLTIAELHLITRTIEASKVRKAKEWSDALP